MEALNSPIQICRATHELANKNLVQILTIIIPSLYAVFALEENGFIHSLRWGAIVSKGERNFFGGIFSTFCYSYCDETASG